MTRYKQKTEIFLFTKPPTCSKPKVCFWFVRMEKNDESKFVTKPAGIVGTIILL